MSIACITTKKYRDKEPGQLRQTHVTDFCDQHGRKRFETLPEGATKKAAKTRLREIAESVGNRTFLLGTRISLSSALAAGSEKDRASPVACLAARARSILETELRPCNSCAYLSAGSDIDPDTWVII